VSETIKYVDINFAEKTVVVTESLLGFIQAKKKVSGYIADTIWQQVEMGKLPVDDCRSQ
jgi:hypothetical protein